MWHENVKKLLLSLRICKTLLLLDFTCNETSYTCHNVKLMKLHSPSVLLHCNFPSVGCKMKLSSDVFYLRFFLFSRKKEIHQRRTALNDDRRIQWLAPVRATEWLHIVKGDLKWCIFRFIEIFFTLFTCSGGRQFSLNNFWIMLFKTLFSAAFICWKLNNEKCMRFNTFNEWKKYAYFSFPYGTLFLLAVHLGITLTSQSFTHTSAILPSHVFY